MKPAHKLVGGVVLAATGAGAFGQGALQKGLSESEVDLMFRYRLEAVDQSGLAENALANTLLSRFTIKTGQIDQWSAVVEVDYVAELIDEDYNNTVNGMTQYPVVADPDGADLNQAYAKYTGSDTTLTLGRQRINHNNQRFVGGVAWRQNEQTFDGVRIESKLGELNVDYAYSSKVNRIFGSRNATGDFSSNLHMLNLTFSPAQGHNVAAFAYYMDLNNAAALSNQTFGLDYRFIHKLDSSTIKLHASYATQKDAGDNPTDYSADYLAVDGDWVLPAVTLSIGYEVLGSDEGLKGFATPLATLHKFQGFADKFLGTPASGIEDTYFKVSTKLSGVALTAIYHQFDADYGSADLGNEFNFVAAYTTESGYGLLAKLAKFDANSSATDTEKAWFMVTKKF